MKGKRLVGYVSLLALLLSLLIGAGTVWAAHTGTTLFVDDDWTGTILGNDPDAEGPATSFGDDAFATIAEALAHANSGDIVAVANGTYEESLDVTKAVTLWGQSRDGVVIDASSFADRGIEVSVTDVTLRRFTLFGPSEPVSGRYGIHASSPDFATVIAITLEDLAVHNSGRSNIDLNGVAASINSVIAMGAQSGVGIALTDSVGTVSNVTLDGNGWGNMAVFSRGFWHPGGSSVTITGTNFFGSPVGLYTEPSMGGNRQ